MQKKKKNARAGSLQYDGQQWNTEMQWPVQLMEHV